MLSKSLPDRAAFRQLLFSLGDEPVQALLRIPVQRQIAIEIGLSIPGSPLQQPRESAMSIGIRQLQL
jgi:hypothetical protein